MDVTLRNADEMTGVIGVDGDVKGVGISQADVFRRKAGDSSGDIQRILSGFQHSGQPVDGSVRIGIAHRLVQGGDDVVVFLAVTVV